ncbi:MAG: HD domain-containing protein [Deltaproteobacteria bacterium]|nr:HD domain-containing protein [Deltaproteobacteria bacterium]
MIRDPVVNLDNLVLSLSDAVDLVHPCAVDHQQRVAYVALRLMQAMGCSPPEQADLMYAAALHDIGVLSVEEKIETMQVETDDWSHHVGFGADLLQLLDIFAPASELVRLHHQPWGEEEAWQGVGENARIASNAIHLADMVDRLARRGAEILGQGKAICDAVLKMSGVEFAPALVKCFLGLAREESFWLDFASPRIYSVLTRLVVWPRSVLAMEKLEQIGQIFSRIVDFRSAFTATHSIGVATTAEELARRMCFGERECRLMRVAGHLHDLGKVAVPNSILEKPAKLDPEEFDVIRGHTYYTYHILTTIGGFDEISMWAAYHHERLNGQGYPFHLTGDDLPLGSRIMCVADVFTAVTENRPYRQGTSRENTEPILHNFVKSDSLDGRIVRLLIDDYEEIDRVRAAAQEAFAAEYERRFPRVIPR